MSKYRLGGLWVLAAVVVAQGCATLAPHERHALAGEGVQLTARETQRPTPLDEYVAAADPAYSFSLARQVAGEGHTVYVIDLISQSWLDPHEVDRTVWQHWLTIIRPHEVATDTALLFIGGGRNSASAPDGAPEHLIETAMRTQSVVAQLGQVPNQPLTFHGDGEPRVEDDLIAYGWDQFLHTGDATWLARLPMTKSAVRAMDAVQEFLASDEAGNLDITGFVVAGGSKRGWTTYTTAAVDTRVVGMVPIVIDLLNVVPSFEHHWQAYGFWAPAVGDYVHHGIMDWTDTPEYEALLDVVEPYSYRDRYTMPKLIMNATGDQFFLPDSSQFYYADLPDPKRLRYVPNADHGMGDTDAPISIASFFLATALGMPLPEYTWEFPAAGTIRVRTPHQPVSVKLWEAHNPEARDFRVDTIGKTWTATELSDEGGGVYTGDVQIPQQGWRAYMIELMWIGPGEVPFKFTTPVRVVPDELPYPLPVVEDVPRGFLSN